MTRFIHPNLLPTGAVIVAECRHPSDGTRGVIIRLESPGKTYAWTAGDGSIRSINQRLARRIASAVPEMEVSHV